MRTPSVVAVVVAWACLVVAACANPDPRHRTLDQVQRDGRGGWIVIKQTPEAVVAGELISVEPASLHVLVGERLVAVARDAIREAELWPWPSNGNAMAISSWGLVGTLSTVSHGYFLLGSAPIWLVTTLVTSMVESRASVIAYPRDDWSSMVIWARFPQGLPPGVDTTHLMAPVVSPNDP